MVTVFEIGSPFEIIVAVTSIVFHESDKTLPFEENSPKLLVLTAIGLTILLEELVKVTLTFSNGVELHVTVPVIWK